MKVTALVPARFRSAELVNTVTPRQFHEVDVLAKAVGDALGIVVPVVEGALADAPADGYILAFDLPNTIDARQGPRIIAFDLDRATVMKDVESLALAGAVEKQRYFMWCTRRADERGVGFIGKRDVAARMSARIPTGPYASEHYAAIASDSATDLIALLAAYLTAYAQAAAGQ